MRLILIITFYVLSQSTLFAHDPLSSFFQLDIRESYCLLSINLSQYGTEQAMIKKYPDLDLSSIEPNKFKETLIDYLKENTKINLNGEDLVFGKGAIKLGSHQTDIKFELRNTPYPPEELHVEIASFQENPKHQNFFNAIYNGEKTRVKLNEENNFRSSIVIDENEMSTDKINSDNSPDYKFVLFSFLSLSMGISYLFMRR